VQLTTARTTDDEQKDRQRIRHALWQQARERQRSTAQQHCRISLHLTGCASPTVRPAAAASVCHTQRDVHAAVPHSSPLSRELAPGAHRSANSHPYCRGGEGRVEGLRAVPLPVDPRDLPCSCLAGSLLPSTIHYTGVGLGRKDVRRNSIPSRRTAIVVCLESPVQRRRCLVDSVGGVVAASD